MDICAYLLKGCYRERQREGGGGFPERQGRPESREELAGERRVPRQLGQAAAAGAGLPGEVWVKVME